jgi:hypothetical protein
LKNWFPPLPLRGSGGYGGYGGIEPVFRYGGRGWPGKHLADLGLPSLRLRLDGKILLELLLAVKGGLPPKKMKHVLGQLFGGVIL